MSVIARQCGVKFNPPSIVLTYEDKEASKLRRRVMPVRNFSKYSDCSRAAERLKHNARHAPYLGTVALEQLVRLHTVLRDHLLGLSVQESLEEQRRADPRHEDLNKLGDEELQKRKAKMDELFQLNRRQRDDPDFVYDLQVEFPENGARDSCSWDQSDDEF